MNPLSKDNVSPHLPKWPFYLANILLVTLAIVMAFRSNGHLTATHCFWCFISIASGTVIFIYPFIKEFKIKAQFQKNKQTILQKDSLARLDYSLQQIQELKESLGQQNQKYAINHNLINTSIQNIDGRLMALSENYEVFQSSLGSIPTDSYQATISSIQESLSQLHDQVRFLSTQSLDNQAPIIQNQDATSSLLDNTDTSQYLSSRLSAPSLDISHPFEDIFADSHDIANNVSEGALSDYRDVTVVHNPPAINIPKLEELVEQNIFNDDLTFIPDDIDMSFLHKETIVDSHKPETAYTLQEENEISCATATLEEETIIKPAKKAQGTLLTVNAMLGIGKKPFVRGQGPGLSWNRGAPMEFLEMGKWQWTSPDSSQPIICRVYKNDEIPAEGEVICLQPGEQIDVTPLFKS